MIGQSSNRRLRVLHVIQNLNYGGMERLIADIVRRTDSDRFESHILVFQYLGRFAEGLEGVASLHRAPPMSKSSMIWPRALARTMRKIAPDVVHSHSGVWYKASLAAKMAGIRRFVHTEHGRHQPDPWRARFLDGMAAARTNIAVAVSDPVADQLREEVVRGRCPVEVVLNGVDTDFYRVQADDGQLRAEIGIGDEPIIGSIGRLEHIKGYDLMVDAFAHLLGSWTGSVQPVLVIAGDGSERPRLEKATAKAGISDQVHFLGWRDDVRSLLGAFTIFTMSSRSEGTSISLLEAMSSELCPVVTRVGGNEAVLGPQLRHRLVRSGDPSALEAAWLDALVQPGKRENDSRVARARVRSLYSLERMVGKYQMVYDG